MIKKIFTIILVSIALSSVTNTSAAPTIYIGLNLDYDFTSKNGTVDYDVTFDNSSFWTVDFLLIMESSTVLDLYIAVNKTALQHTYNFTEYHKATGSTNAIAQGFLAWIDTDDLIIGENILIQGDSSEVMEQIDLTIPLGTFSVYNVSQSAEGNNFYYDVITGFLIRAHNPGSGDNMILDNSSSIYEFPTLVFPVLLVAIPIVIKFTKFSKR